MRSVVLLAILSTVLSSLLLIEISVSPSTVPLTTQTAVRSVVLPSTLSMVRFYAASRAVAANRAASDTDGYAIGRATGHAVTGFVCCAVNRAVSLFDSRAAGRVVG